MNKDVSHCYNLRPWQFAMLFFKLLRKHIGGLTDNFDTLHDSEISTGISTELLKSETINKMLHMLGILHDVG